MKQFRVFFLMAVLAAPCLVFAQDEKEKTDKKESQTIIITRKGVGADDKNVTVEVKGDKIYVDGKLLDDKDKTDNIDVKVMKVKDPQNLRIARTSRNYDRAADDYNFFYQFDSVFNTDKAMLGVSTQKVEGGVEVQSVTKESGAEKAGIKEKDIITRVDGDKIEDPDDLTKAVQKHKAGDKISVTVLRDNKELKLNAELTKWKGSTAFTMDNFKFDMGNIERYLPRTPIAPRVWAGNGPKLGLSIQDNEDGKGVKVTEVDQDDSNAFKAGIKEGDIITEADGKTINNADDMVNVIRQAKEKISINLKITRNGKTQNIEVKMPRKLRTADL